MVHTAGIPWVAAREAADGKPAPLDGTMDGNRFKGIRRA
jgi:hypothetical protein